MSTGSTQRNRAQELGSAQPPGCTKTHPAGGRLGAQIRGQATQEAALGIGMKALGSNGQKDMKTLAAMPSQVVPSPTNQTKENRPVRPQKTKAKVPDTGDELDEKFVMIKVY